MDERLVNAHRIIDDLNAKIRHMMENASRHNLTALLQKIRDELQREFEAYRCQVEEAMKQTLAEMRARLDQRLCEKQQLEEEKDRIEDRLAKLQGHLNQTLHEVFRITHRVAPACRVISSRETPQQDTTKMLENRFCPQGIRVFVHKALLRP